MHRGWNGPLVADSHGFGLRDIEDVAHAVQERALLDFNSLLGGMEVRRYAVAVRHPELDHVGRRLARISGDDRHLCTFREYGGCRPPVEVGWLDRRLGLAPQGAGENEQGAREGQTAHRDLAG